MNWMVITAVLALLCAVRAYGNEQELPKVPEPWTPVRIKGESLECWNRVYDFSNQILPAQIKSGDAKLFSGPVELVAKTSGKLQKWTSVNFNVIKSSPDIVSFKTTGRSGQLEAAIIHRFEFDGFLLCELTLKPLTSTITLDSLDLVIPLNPKYAKLFHHHPIKPVAEQKWATDTLNCGAMSESGLRLPFVHHIWIGDEQRGLQWFAESDQGLKKSDGFITVDKSGNMTLSLLGNKTLSVSKPFHFTFGFMASPVKPKVPAEEIRWSFAWVDPKVWNHDVRGTQVGPEASRLADMHRKDINAFNVWGTQFKMGNPYIADPELPNMLASARKYGMAPLTCAGIWLDERTEGYSDEWRFGPAMTWKHPTRPEYVGHLMCQRGPWQRWFMDTVTRAFNDLGIQGIYLDGSGTPQKCNNTAHGCGYKDEEGNLHSTLPILPTREVMKHIYLVSRSHGRKSYVVAHTSSTITLPCLSFADVYFEGEHVGRFPEDERYTLEGFRAEMMGHPYGITAYYLKYNREPGDELRCSAYAAVHDMMPVSADNMSLIYRARKDFKASSAEWVPYWSSEKPVKTKADLKVSSYIRRNDGALCVLANLTHSDVTADLKVEPAALGLKTIKARDAVDGIKLPVDDNSISVNVKAGSYRLIRIYQ